MGPAVLPTCLPGRLFPPARPAVCTASSSVCGKTAGTLVADSEPPNVPPPGRASDLRGHADPRAPQGGGPAGIHRAPASSHPPRSSDWEGHRERDLQSAGQSSEPGFSAETCRELGGSAPVASVVIMTVRVIPALFRGALENGALGARPNVLAQRTTDANPHPGRAALTAFPFQTCVCYLGAPFRLSCSVPRGHRDRPALLPHRRQPIGDASGRESSSRKPPLSSRTEPSPRQPRPCRLLCRAPGAVAWPPSKPGALVTRSRPTRRRPLLTASWGHMILTTVSATLKGNDSFSNLFRASDSPGSCRISTAFSPG